VTRPGNQIAGWLVGVAIVAVPLVYLPDVLPSVLGLRLLPFALPPVFDFALLPKLLLLQGLLVGALIASGITLYRSTGYLRAQSTLVLPVRVYLLLSIASMLWAPNLVEGVWQAAGLLTMAMLFTVVTSSVPSEWLSRLMRLAAATGAVVSCIGITQYFGWAYSDIPTVGNPSATFGYRNFAASYLVAAIPIALALALAARSAARTAGWTCALSLMLLFLIYTRTRGAWLGLGGAILAAACLLWWLRMKHGTRLPLPRLGRAWIVAAGVAIVLACGALPHRMEREGKFGFDEKKADALTTLRKTFSPGDSRGRLTVWAHTLEMVLANPVLGVGLGGWQFVYPAYDRGDSITDNAAPQRPHNDFLWILAETGLAGFAAYLWIFLSAGTLVWRSLRRFPRSPQTLQALGVATGLIALLGHSLLSFPKERIGPSMMLWFGLAAIAVLCDHTVRPARKRQASAYIPIFLGALALVMALGVTVRRIRFDEHYLLALKAWRAQDWHAVRQQAEQAVSWGPLNHRAMLLSGVAHQQLGQAEQAAAAFERSLRYHPNEGHLALAAVYAEQGRYDLAAQHYGIEQRLYPRSLEAGLGLASALRRLGRTDEAAEAYRKLLASHPESSEVLTGLGASLQAFGDAEGALDAFRQARRLRPEDARVCSNVGAVLAALNRFEEAESAYQEALRLDPGYTRVYHNLGDLYLRMGRRSEASRAYRSFIDRWQGDPRFLDLARQKLRTTEGVH